MVPPEPAAPLDPSLRLPRRFFAKDSLELAPDLLNKVLVMSDGRAGRIIEVEAYHGGDDPGSHAYRGQTARNAVMFGPPGFLYVYFTYGMHWCANVVCAASGLPQAVLLRALDPVAGLDQMRRARWRAQRSQRDRDLCRGPARLCQALGIDGDDNGADLVAEGGRISLVDDGTRPPVNPLATTRVGLSAGADRPWRWLVADHPGVSGPRSRPSRAPGRSEPTSAGGAGPAVVRRGHR